MHELSVATELYRACRTEVQARGGGRLTEVSVAVGELSAVEPELLRFAWQAVIAETRDAEANLQVEWRPTRQRCAECGEIGERQAGSWLRLCPICEGPLQIEGGRELDIQRFTYDVEEDIEEDIEEEIEENTEENTWGTPQPRPPEVTA